MAINIEQLLETLQTERKQRYETGLGELRKVAEMYGPEYLKGQEHTALAGMEQSMVGRGLGGTTRPAAVSAGMKAGFESQRIEARAGAGRNIAEYMAGFPGGQTEAYLATGGFSGMLGEEIARAPGGPLDPNRPYTTGGGGLSPTARAGLDVFGQPMGSGIVGTGSYAPGAGGQAARTYGGLTSLPAATAGGGTASGYPEGYDPTGDPFSPQYTGSIPAVGEKKPTKDTSPAAFAEYYIKAGGKKGGAMSYEQWMGT